MSPILQAAVSILREHAAGRIVDRDRLDWAIRTYEQFAPQTRQNPTEAPHAA